MRHTVELRHASRLLNTGPTVLVSSRHGAQQDVMAAAWNMPLDFEPPKIAVVIDKNTFTRGLIEASGEFVIAVPCVAQAAMVTGVGHCSGPRCRQVRTLRPANPAGFSGGGAADRGLPCLAGMPAHPRSRAGAAL